MRCLFIGVDTTQYKVKIGCFLNNYFIAIIFRNISLIIACRKRLCHHLRIQGLTVITIIILLVIAGVKINTGPIFEAEQ